MSRRPTRAGRRVIRYMAAHDGLLINGTDPAVFELDRAQLGRVLDGLYDRGLIESSGVGSVLTRFGWDEDSGKAASRRRSAAQLGELNHRCVLDEHEVREIRAAAARGETQCSLADRYRTAQSNIHKIIHRETWAGVR